MNSFAKFTVAPCPMRSRWRLRARPITRSVASTSRSPEWSSSCPPGMKPMAYLINTARGPIVARLDPRADYHAFSCVPRQYRKRRFDCSGAYLSPVGALHFGPFGVQL